MRSELKVIFRLEDLSIAFGKGGFWKLLPDRIEKMSPLKFSHMIARGQIKTNLTTCVIAKIIVTVDRIFLDETN